MFTTSGLRLFAETQFIKDRVNTIATNTLQKAKAEATTILKDAKSALELLGDTLVIILFSDELNPKQ